MCVYVRVTVVALFVVDVLRCGLFVCFVGCCCLMLRYFCVLVLCVLFLMCVSFVYVHAFVLC